MLDMLDMLYYGSNSVRSDPEVYLYILSCPILSDPEVSHASLALSYPVQFNPIQFCSYLGRYP
jgi:hypothetical protein